MKITFLGQGFKADSENSVGSYLIRFLSQMDFHAFTGISAFASEAGVLGLSEYITNAKNNFESLSLIVGVDQGGTSKEALLEINNLGINSYIFYQKESPIFHPKIYLFEGKTETKLIIGSSNLTATGLFSNVESSVLIEFLHDDAEGQQILHEIKEYFNGLFDFSDPNLFKIDSEVIEDFITKGIVPNENVRLEKYSKQSSEKAVNEEINLEVPKRATAKIPASFRGKSKAGKIVSKIIKELEIQSIEINHGRLLWTRKNLPASSVQRSAGGNPTGGLRLVQDDFTVNETKIDQTTYFRNQVFGGSVWRQIRTNPVVELATANFNVEVRGENIGLHSLEIRHKPSGEAGQGNYTTSISWGELGETIRDANLTGARLDLYAPEENSDVFTIIIS